MSEERRDDRRGTQRMQNTEGKKNKFKFEMSNPFFDEKQFRPAQGYSANVMKERDEAMERAMEIENQNYHN